MEIIPKIVKEIEGEASAFCFHGVGEPPHWEGILWGVDPFLTITAYGSQITIQEKGKANTFEGDSLLTLRTLLDRYSRGGCGGAAVGFLSYELWPSLGLGITSRRVPTGFPTLFFAFYNKIHRETVPNNPQNASSNVIPAKAGIQDFFKTLDSHFRENDKSVIFSGAQKRELESFSNLSRSEYIGRVKKIQNYIAAGDIYQANFTQRFSIPYASSLSQAFLNLCQNHPVPYGAYLRCGDLEILSNSPECFLKYDPQTRALETWPIKGTRPRGATTSEDARLCEELLTSAKDRAENLMIVDLERSDLGRVCETGSVEVPRLCEARSYGTVHHLVSQVRGIVRRDCDRIDILRACFPGGSVTGAPKLRALEILEELEPSPREVYTGAIGYLGFDGSLHFNVAIRTAWRIGDKLCYAAGGGIVADSDPEKEYGESLLKASILQYILGEAV